MRISTAAALAACLAVATAGPLGRLAAQDMSYKPDVAPASPEAQQASKSFRVAPGTKVSLFAAEPMLANPVAFCVDERGRFFVCETFRHQAGVTDNRNHMNWLDADVACRSVDDRVEMYRKYLGKDGFAAFNVEHERVRLIEDKDGDGVADAATVFADGFKDAADGIGAGVLARKGTSTSPASPTSGGSRIPTTTARPTSGSRSAPATASTSPCSATTSTASRWGRMGGCTSRSATAG